MTTIHDIAKALGIAPSTVSRALSGSTLINKNTRENIERMALKMGYERNVMASNLRKGVTNIVGIIVPRVNRQFFSNVISGAESILDAAGYSVIICQSHEKLAYETKALKTIRRNQVAGLLISHSIETKEGGRIIDIMDKSVRLVQFDRVFSDLPGAKIVNNNFEGAYAATCHLIEQGYKRVGTLAGYMNARHYRDRLDGYCAALKDHGIEVDEDIIFLDAIVRETGHENAVKAIAKGCDAIYSAGDFSALGAMDAAKEAGLSIPLDFGIVGTANEIFTSLMHPSMSSIEMNPKEIGMKAAEAFLKGSDETVIIPMTLIERESSCRKNILKNNTKLS